MFDATSGKTGNNSRDHKMHKDVIESGRYPEIVFRPDRADGVLAVSGASTLQVHGMFAMHGAEHEVTFPVAITFAGSAWAAKASFQVPYVRWGMKNPSKLFLRFDDVVQVAVSRFRKHSSIALAYKAPACKDPACNFLVLTASHAWPCGIRATNP